MGGLKLQDNAFQDYYLTVKRMYEPTTNMIRYIVGPTNGMPLITRLI